MSTERKTLWRATSAEHPHLGHASWWTAERNHAERYRRMPGFGGPTLYRARVDIEPARVLDLRSEPWQVLGFEFGLEREDYGTAEEEHELIWSLSRVLASGGYTWAVIAVEHPAGTADEWLYLDEQPIRVERES